MHAIKNVAACLSGIRGHGWNNPGVVVNVACFRYNSLQSHTVCAVANGNARRSDILVLHSQGLLPPRSKCSCTQGSKLRVHTDGACTNESNVART